MRQPLKNWFTEPGAYVLVDGQFGSTGKGLMAGYIADLFVRDDGMAFNYVTTNAGPNSGHTAYFRTATPNSVQSGNPVDDHLEKIVTQQLPIAGVFATKYGYPVPMVLNAGAIIDEEILNREHSQYGGKLYVHPCAALIDQVHAVLDKQTTAQIASTGKGVGPAMAQKLMRLDMDCVASKKYLPVLPPGRDSWDNLWDWGTDRVFVETAQGYSLGINSSRFYPYTTSRECTVMQAIADARIPAQMVRKVIATYRTYPIRVGNTQGSSGGCYPDQEETSWEALRLKPELTTVTGRIRRVFTWSRVQFRESIAANRPDAIFLNFMNYIGRSADQADFIEQVVDDYQKVMGRFPEDLLIGHGRRSSDVVVYNV